MVHSFMRQNKAPAHTVLPNGKTVYEQMADDVVRAIQSGGPVRLSLEGGS